MFRFVIGVLFCFCAFSAQAQVVHSKQIYLWDVTLSMKQNGIWDQVKEQMVASLTEVKDLDTEVIVIPFQDDVYEERRVTVGDAAAMADLVQWIEGYDVPMPKGGHGTNICRALERAEDFVIKENIDCVFLMTDGTHEPKRADMAQHYPEGCLTEYLEDRWCTFATELDAYLVYYHLLGNADPDIQRVTEETCRAMGMAPGDGTPDRLYYISPQVQVIARDEAFHFGAYVLRACDHVTSLCFVRQLHLQRHAGGRGIYGSVGHHVQWDFFGMQLGCLGSGKAGPNVSCIG